MGIPIYEGLVSTRGFSPVAKNTANRQCMTRWPMIARGNITRAKWRFPNFMIDTASPFAEVGTGSAATIEASVEYPIGTMTRLLFSGVNQGSIPDIGTLDSDYLNLPITIPDGATYCIRHYITSSTGVMSLNQDISGVGTILYGGLEVGVSGITNKVMSGTVTAADNGWPVLAAIGLTSRPSVVVYGDSITEGMVTKDTIGDATGDFGSICRTIGPAFGYSCMAQNGDRALSYLLSNTNRTAMMDLASHSIIGYGSNDVFGASRTGAQLLTDVKAMTALMSSRPNIGSNTRKTFPVTLLPRSTSTNGWITTGTNQTTVSGDTRKTAYNDLLRAGNVEFGGYFELADVLESSRNSGLWKAPGGVAQTDDGIHPITVGNILIRDSGAINTALITLLSNPIEDAAFFLVL